VAGEDGAAVHHEGTKGTKLHEATTTPHEMGGFVSFVFFVPSW